MTTVDQVAAAPNLRDRRAADARRSLAADRRDRGWRSRCCRPPPPSWCWPASRRSRRPTRSWSRCCSSTRVTGLSAARHHRPRSLGRRPGAPPRPRRRAAARAHRRPVLGHRGGAGDPGRGRRQRRRSTAASTAVFSTRTRAMIEKSLIVAEAYVREHAQTIRGEIIGDGLRPQPRQADVRPGPRPVPPIPHRPGHRARALPRPCIIRPTSSTRRARRHHDGQGDSCCRRAEAAQPDHRDRAAGRAYSRRRPRRRGRSSCAATTTFISMSRALLDPRVVAAIARDPGERRANTPISRRAGSASRSPSR